MYPRLLLEKRQLVFLALINLLVVLPSGELHNKFNKKEEL